jgi:superfamily II DNA/RNA helicase
MTFDSLGLAPELVTAVHTLGYETPTPVQTAAIPVVLRGGDVWVSAETGSGKTAAFVLPLLTALSRKDLGASRPRPVRVLVLAPTRELAAQIEAAFTTYGQDLPDRPKTCVLVGGVSENPQMMSLRGGADVVVATPGRLLDLVEKNALSLGAVETLVLDEADRLLSLGFGEELERVLAMIPKKRQTLLFSATFPPAVKSLAEARLTQPTRVQIAPEVVDIPRITQRAIRVDTGKRTLLLRHLITTHEWPTVLVFVASRHSANHVAEKLSRAKIAVASLHGELSQGTRAQALADIQSGRIQVLVATDVAARGLDIPGLPAVVNYDLPRSPTDYIHRIGRTGRAGESGVAVSFLTADTEAHFALIEKRHKMRVDREELPGFQQTEEPTPNLDPHGGVKGKRKSKKDKLREAAARAATPKG